MIGRISTKSPYVLTLDRFKKIMATQADLESDLRFRFPEAFQDGNSSQFTFRCGQGWFAIVGTLCSLLSEANGRGTQAPTYLLSAMEKMGTLRILTSHRDSSANEWIRFAERHAVVTCEICGENGRLLYSEGWQRVRCNLHTLSLRLLDSDE